MDLKKHIKKIKDYPQKGVFFYDITTLLMLPEVFDYIQKEWVLRLKGVKVDKIAAVESRGFIFAPVLAYSLKVPVVLLRKPGKLPGEVVAVDYTLEYGKGRLEIQKDKVVSGENVLVVDDLLATGGTVEAISTLLEKTLRAKVVGIFSVVGLDYLGYEEKLKAFNTNVLVKYDKP